MPKLLVLTFFLMALSLAMALTGYQKIPVSNEKVTAETLEKNYLAKLALIHRDEFAAEEADQKDEGAVDIVAEGMKVYTANCISCHGETGDGEGEIPKLSGQFDWYVVIQLKDFKAGKRELTAEHDLSQLTVDDFKAVGAYIQSL